MREKVKEAGLFLWEVAEKVGVSEWTLCRWLRHEPTGEKLTRIERAVEELVREREEAGKC